MKDNDGLQSEYFEAYEDLEVKLSFITKHNI